MNNSPADAFAILKDLEIGINAIKLGEGVYGAVYAVKNTYVVKIGYLVGEEARNYATIYQRLVKITPELKKYNPELKRAPLSYFAKPIPLMDKCQNDNFVINFPHISQKIKQKLIHPNGTSAPFDPCSQYMITEYRDGFITLTKYLRSKNYSQDSYEIVIKKIAGALFILHNLVEIVHEDFHFDNVLVNPGTDKILIIDFGLAKPLQNATYFSIPVQGKATHNNLSIVTGENTRLLNKDMFVKERKDIHKAYQLIFNAAYGPGKTWRGIFWRFKHLSNRNKRSKSIIRNLYSPKTKEFMLNSYIYNNPYPPTKTSLAKILYWLIPEETPGLISENLNSNMNAKERHRYNHFFRQIHTPNLTFCTIPPDLVAQTKQSILTNVNNIKINNINRTALKRLQNQNLQQCIFRWFTKYHNIFYDNPTGGPLPKDLSNTQKQKILSVLPEKYINFVHEKIPTSGIKLLDSYLKRLRNKARSATTPRTQASR
jgi:serine/threonine protein kinase